MRNHGFLISSGGAFLLILLLVAPAMHLAPALIAAARIDPASTPGPDLAPATTMPLSLAALYDPAYAGFDWGLPPGVTIEPLAGGITQNLADGPGTLQLDRVVLAPGEPIDVSQAHGPLVLYVESGTLTFIDELGLEAQAVSGAQQFLEDGAAYAVRNDTTEQASLLWLRFVPLSVAVDSGQATFTVQTIELYDGSVYPDSVTIPAEVPVELRLENRGSSFHNFTIDALNVSSGEIGPGNSQQITVVAPAGTYQFYDSDSGYRGSLIAAPADPTLASAAATPAAALATPPETLFAGQVSAAPTAPALLFLMRVRLDPGADLGQQTLAGPVGLVAESGATTVIRPGRLPAQLQPGQRAGRVLFPTNYPNQETNVGTESVSVIMAGLVPANQALLLPTSDANVVVDEGDDITPEEAATPEGA